MRFSAARSNPSAVSARQADGDGPLLRVRRGERRQPAHVGDVGRRRAVLAPRAEDPVEPVARAGAQYGAVDRRRRAGRARPRAHGGRSPSGRALRLTGSGSPESSASSSSPARRRASRSSLNVADASTTSSPSAVAIRVGVEHGQRRLRGSQRAISSSLHWTRQARIAFSSASWRSASSAARCLPGRPRAAGRAARRRRCRQPHRSALVEHGVLLAREQIRVAGDDLGLLARLLLADPHRPGLL